VLFIRRVISGDLYREFLAKEVANLLKDVPTKVLGNPLELAALGNMCEQNSEGLSRRGAISAEEPMWRYEINAN
jgi:hypothetical protein